MNDGEQLDKLFNELKKIDRTNLARLNSLEKIQNRFNKRSIRMLPILLSGIVSIAVVFFMASINDFSFMKTEEHSLVDEHTADTIQNINVNELFLIEYDLDNMDRGNHEFMTQNINKKILIDPNASNFKRGEILYFSTPRMNDDHYRENIGPNNDPSMKVPKQQIARVVGLPGEKIEIIKGQVFIDDRKLDTFYGVATVKGKTKTEYLEKLFPHGSNSINFEVNMNPIVVPNESVFVLGDQWWRSVDSRFFGPLPIVYISGKVLGYESP